MPKHYVVFPKIVAEEILPISRLDLRDYSFGNGCPDLDIIASCLAYHYGRAVTGFLYTPLTSKQPYHEIYRKHYQNFEAMRYVGLTENHLPFDAFEYFILTTSETTMGSYSTGVNQFGQLIQLLSSQTELTPCIQRDRVSFTDEMNLPRIVDTSRR